MAVTITGGFGTGSATTSSNISVAASSTEVLAENTSRYGVEIVNESANKVWLALGKAAEEKKGMFLAPNGGTWNGEVSKITWRGSIFAIASAASSNITVTEF